VIKYYLTAADESGRHASAPFIGSADPFTFQTVYTGLTAVPDTLWFITTEDALTGKITQVHNFTAGPISMDSVQMIGQFIPWWVDSISVAVPHALNTGDSIAIRVKIPLTVNLNPAIYYDVDSLRITSGAGVSHVIIMINHDLLIAIAEHPAGSSMGRNYPNPFSSVTSIPLNLPEGGNVQLEIFDISGKKVRTLVSQMAEPGFRSVQWDGTGSDGNELPGGIYLCRLVTPNNVETMRIALIH